MKPFKPMLIWLLLPVLIHSIVAPTIADDVEKWRKELQKDYRKILEARKKQVERHRKLVKKWQEKGRLADLIFLYEADAETERADAPLHYGLGYAYAIHGSGGPEQNAFFEKAANQFESAISLNPKMLMAHFSLGGIYQQQGQFARALQEMETCLRLHPKYSLAHYKRGEIYLEQDNPAAALESFRAALEINQKWAYPHYGMGLAYFKQGNDNAAREAFVEAINRNKKFAAAYFKLGQVLAKERRFDEALRGYEKGAEYQNYTAEALCELGVIFAQEANANGAIDLYQRALAIDSTYSLAHLQLGDLYYAADQKALAIEHYQQGIAADPALKDYFFEQLGPYHAGLMGMDEAKSLLDRSLAVMPGDPRADVYYAQIEADAGNLTAAIQHYEKTIAFIESDESALEIELPLGNLLDAYLLLGDVYFKQGDDEQAAATYRRAIERDAMFEQHFFDLGKTAFDAEQFNQATEPLQKFLLIFPEHIDATYLLGRSYEALGELDHALALYARTIELHGNHTEALMRSAQVYRQQNDSQNALTMLARLITIHPENIQAHYLSGLSHLELESFDDALAAFLEITRLDPNHVDAHYRAALLYEQRGDSDNAIERYETIIKLEPSRAETFLRLGAIYLQRGDIDNVIRVYEPGLAIEPNHPQAQYDLAASFETHGENEKAIKHLGLANQYDETHFDWHFRYAHLLDRHAETLEDYDQYAAMAVEEYGRTIALKPDYAPVYFHRALITRRYKQIGDVLYRYSQIAEDFKQVVALEPRNADAHYYLGMTYVDLDQQKKAKTYFQTALKFNRKYKGANLQLGLIAEWEQQYPEAIKRYEAEAAIDPKSARVYQRLGDLYNNSSRDFGRASEALEKALELEPNHVPTLINYGNTLFNLDRLGAATEQFELVLQLEPKDFTANYNLALMYEYTGKKQQAINRWKKFLKLNPPAEWKSEAENHLRQLGGQQ
ncbi:MAG: tetratricopeptide repeat protein [Candidatus Poribacteria bacterium]|nr:tetratricopeptide repeat protein [Candidatus Poribacteria bacterium]